MKKVNLIILATLLSAGIASTSFAEQWTVTYRDYQELTPDACPASIVMLLNSKERLKLTYDTSDYNSVQLIGSPTAGVSVADQIFLGNEGIKRKYAYMSTEDTFLQIANNSYVLHQLWLESPTKQGPWQSAFYVNGDCLVMDRAMSAKSPLADLQFKK